jgi:2-phosphosulfolactate phosphatase
VTTTAASQRPAEQQQYQVRFDWGADGARAIGGSADVVVLVDVLGPARDVDQTPNIEGIGTAVVVVEGSLRNATALARWALERQAGKGDRFTVAVVAAGESRGDGSVRFALEDLLGAGAIIDALASVGIDYASPEAAAAAAAFTGLRNATGHLISASTSGRRIAADGGRAHIDFAIDVNASDDVRVLREFSFGS